METVREKRKKDISTWPRENVIQLGEELWVLSRRKWLWRVVFFLGGGEGEYEFCSPTSGNHHTVMAMAVAEQRMDPALETRAAPLLSLPAAELAVMVAVLLAVQPALARRKESRKGRGFF